MQSLKLLPFDRGPTSHLPILQAILEISFKMMILLRYSSYKNYLLRYMYINFLGNRPQAESGVTEITQTYVHTCNSLFICQLYSLPNLHEETDCKEDMPLTLPFASFVFPLTVDNSDMN